MNAERTFTASLSGGHCLSTVALRQYVDGTLPRQDLHRVEKHLLDCDFCTHVLEDMDVTDEGRTAIESISENVNRRILDMVGQAPKPGLWAASRTYFYVGGGVLILLSSVLLYTFHTGKEHSAVTTLATPPALQQPPTSPVPDNATKKPVEDEFETKHTTAAPVPEKTVSVNTTTPGPIHEDDAPALVSKPESPAAANPDPAPPKKEEPKPETVTEKVNYADLQIVTVKVLQMMSKVSSSSSSRKEGSRNGQISKSKDTSPAYYMLEDMPSYPGGQDAMEEYLATHFKNPVKDKRNLTGKAVGVMFNVSSKGRISDVEITRSIAPELDVEIIRLISSMPSWDPGKHKGDITCVLVVTVK
ncbi:MAG TPA: zf-HC2 domain-containing protein [Bacteroidia bacterium]|jgi:hypothetical protein|nr:zf-HC2 domain-containing protein [Bacteroidia bacterium]